MTNNEKTTNMQTEVNNYERINLDDYIQTGEGGTAITYSSKDGKTLAKLYNPGFEADRARAEFLTSRTVFGLGIPTPEPYRLVTDGERFGAEYELIKDKRSFARIISQEPGRLEEISVTFARLARELHAKQADTTRLHSYKQVLKRFYLEKEMVPEDYRQRALNFIEQVPDATTCVLGDLHIGNIITDGKRILWIDLGEFAYGVPEWDLGIYWRMTHMTDARQADYLVHLTPETLAAHWDIFYPAYLGTTDPKRIEEATRRLLPYFAVKVPYVYDMAFQKHLPEPMLQRINQLLG